MVIIQIFFGWFKKFASMAQAFVTIYRDAYRVHPIERRKSLRPVDKVAETLPDGDIWIVPKKIGEDDGGSGQSLAEAKEAIKKMNRRRLYSTYQVSYSIEAITKPMSVEEEEKLGKEASPLMEMCKTLYQPKTQKIPPPLPTARRLYGYIRPSRMYYPLTVVQNVHGKVGCEVMLNNRDRIRGIDKSKTTSDGSNVQGSKAEEKKTEMQNEKAQAKDSNDCNCTCYRGRMLISDRH